MSYLVQEHGECDRRQAKAVSGVISPRGKSQCSVDETYRPITDTMSSMASSHKTLSCQTVLLFSILLLLVCALETTLANPIEEWPQSHSQSKTPKPLFVNECGPRGVMKIESLCQRCAKSTKSEVVYPMCCQNREAAREWCRQYMGFGIQ